MKGYVRRKITYNLAKGGKRHSRKTEPSSRNVTYTLNPRYWFLEPPDNGPEYAVIVDEAGTFYIDNEYRELGVREGWLILNRHYTNIDDALVLEYRYCPPD